MNIGTMGNLHLFDGPPIFFLTLSINGKVVADSSNTQPVPLGLFGSINTALNCKVDTYTTNINGVLVPYPGATIVNVGITAGAGGIPVLTNCNVAGCSAAVCAPCKKGGDCRQFNPLTGGPTFTWTSACSDNYKMDVSWTPPVGPALTTSVTWTTPPNSATVTLDNNGVSRIPVGASFVGKVKATSGKTQLQAARIRMRENGVNKSHGTALMRSVQDNNADGNEDLKSDAKCNGCDISSPSHPGTPDYLVTDVNGELVFTYTPSEQVVPSTVTIFADYKDGNATNNFKSFGDLTNDTCWNFNNVYVQSNISSASVSLLVDTIITNLSTPPIPRQIKPFQTFSVQSTLTEEDVTNVGGPFVGFPGQIVSMSLIGTKNSGSLLSNPTGPDGSTGSSLIIGPATLPVGTLPNYPPNYPIKPDTYNVLLQYSGDSTHKPVNVVSTLTVDKINTAFTNISAPQSLFVLSNGSISGTLMDTDQKIPIQNAPIQIFLDGVQIGPVYTDAKGVFILDVTGKSLGGAGDSSKNHSINIQFLEDTYYLGASTSKTIVVSKSQPSIRISPAVTISTLGSTDVTGAITDINPGSLNGLPIQLTVDGVSAGNLMVDSSGSFKLVVQGSALSVGNHTVSASFAGDANRQPAASSTTITIRPATSVVSWASGQSQSVYVEQDINYNGTLTVEGHPLSGATVVIVIGNKQTQLTTGADGSFVFVAHFVDAPGPIVYTIQAIYGGTNDERIAKSTSSLNVTAARAPPVEYRTTLAANYDNKTDVLVATLASPQFGSCFQNVPLDVKVDGENAQTVPTDQQGTISIKMGLSPGDHTIVVTFKGVHTEKYICDQSTQSVTVTVQAYEVLGRLVPTPYLLGGVALLVIGVAAYSLLSKAVKKEPSVSFWSKGSG